MKKFGEAVLLLAVTVFLCACQTKPAKIQTAETEVHPKENQFFTIYFAEIIKHKQEVPILEIAEGVEYIPLENNKESMLGNIMDIQLTDDYIFVKHNGSRLLTQFDWSGNFIRHIGTEGRGPKEYGLMRAFSIDEKNKLIYIHTNRTRKILVYSFDGEYIKTLKFPAVERLHCVWSRDSFMVSYSSPNSGKNLYSFIETSFSGDTTQTTANYMLWDKKGERSFTVSYWGRDEFFRAANQLNMKSWYNDTVYSYNKNNKIVPRYFIDLKEYKIPDDLIPERMSEKPLPKECYWVGLNESANFIFIRYGSHMDRTKSEEEMEEGCVFYNKNTREGIALKNKGEDYGFLNDLNAGPDFKPRFSNDSLMFVDVTAMDMKLYLDSEKFKNQAVKIPEQKEKLVQLNKKLKEDGNSFIMLAKLKK